MPCKWCGGSGHLEDNCPTRNLVMFLQDIPPERWDAKLPDVVVALPIEDALDEIEAWSKLRTSEQTARKE